MNARHFTVQFYGASDDLIEVEGDAPGCDEYNTEKAVFLVVAENGAKAYVGLRYAMGGVWAAEVVQVDEDVPLPSMRVDSEKYSARVTIEGVELVARVADDGS